MPEQTEAACLLVGGTAYRKRTLIHPEAGGDVFVGVRAGGFSIYRDDEPIVHFDFEGRWQRAYVGGIHYLKALDTSIRSIDRVRVDESLVLRRRTLSDAESASLDGLIRDGVIELLATIDGRKFAISERSHKGQTLTPEEVRDLLHRSAAWDAPTWSADRDRYRATYGPLPFVPPTCPSPLILQASITAGFARVEGNAPRRRGLDEFAEHIEAVGRLVGRRLASSRDLFLDGLDPLGRPPDEAIGIVEAAVRRFPVARSSTNRGEGGEEDTPLASIQAMIDDFSGDPPGPDFWARLQGLGLTHLTLGVESGDPTIRSKYGKSWADGRLVGVARALREARIVADLVVLIGAGGAGGSAAHVEATSALVRSLPPSSIRRVYLVDARTFEGGPVGQTPLTDGQAAEQAASLKAAFGAAPGEGRPGVVIYNADKQPI